ncbi:MAG: hypothetical protein AAF327_21820, partial [Cyanobacteria bacterium P01_A01_bin.37]
FIIARENLNLSFSRLAAAEVAGNMNEGIAVLNLFSRLCISPVGVAAYRQSCAAASNSNSHQ